MRSAGVTLVLALVVTAACGGSTAPPSAGPGPGNRETGAVSTVTQTDRSAGDSDLSLEEFLRGQVPGLQFLPTPDGGFTLRIRGGSDAAEPLVVIDNAPVQPGQLSRVLESLNPNDIARVQVLRDVASTARYGTRGAYGVLLITTKKR